MATDFSPRLGPEDSPGRSRHRRGRGRARIADAVTAVLPEHGSARHHGVGFWAVALGVPLLALFGIVAVLVVPVFWPL